MVNVPAPFGLPLLGGCDNIAFSAWFGIFAFTYKEEGIESRDVVAA